MYGSYRYSNPTVCVTHSKDPQLNLNPNIVHRNKLNCGMPTCFDLFALKICRVLYCALAYCVLR